MHPCSKSDEVLGDGHVLLFGKTVETEHSGRQFCWLVLDTEPHIGVLVDLCKKIDTESYFWIRPVVSVFVFVFLF